MKISCIIIEDQPPAQRILQRYISDIETLELKGIFTDGIAALSFLNQNSIQLLFLDIHLPKISGVELLKILSPQPNVILTTAFSEYALEGYELDVTDYLLKPFSFERFVKAVTKVIYLQQKQIPVTQQIKEEKELTIFIKSGCDYIKININDIQYIKTNGDYTTIYSGDSQHLVSYSLKYWLQYLPSEMFYQIHKSYLVNVNAIEKVSNNQVYLGKNPIPIGRTFREIFFKNYIYNH